MIPVFFPNKGLSEADLSSFIEVAPTHVASRERTVSGNFRAGAALSSRPGGRRPRRP